MAQTKRYKPKVIISGQSETAKFAVETTVHCPDLESGESHSYNQIQLYILMKKSQKKLVIHSDGSGCHGYLHESTLCYPVACKTY